jgi:hypothetical protein
LTKPITGSWFEFQHHSVVEGKYWDPACERFTCGQWDVKIREMADLGFEYLVLMCVACFEKAFYPTRLYPRRDMACPDPMAAMFDAADRYGLKVFVGNGYYGKELVVTGDPEIDAVSAKAMEELAGLYGSQKSFHGWYFPCEAAIDPRFPPAYVDYVKDHVARARVLTPGKSTLIAPYWASHFFTPDDVYVRQLEDMGVDIVAYQDGVGVKHSTVDQLASRYEALRKAYDKAPGVALWADMEVFDFEGEVYRSALLPANFERVKA